MPVSVTLSRGNPSWAEEREKKTEVRRPISQAFLKVYTAWVYSKLASRLFGTWSESSPEPYLNNPL